MVEEMEGFRTLGEELSAQPTQVGGYQILRVLGRGGMGTVYLARQDVPVSREVALKIINWGMETENVLARFRQEQESLALMNHPYIARVYDAGTTSEGLPFFVMESVNGEPILEYCDNRKLATKARLHLFLKVCEGVRHAHQQMVIHRDIKPSNILVTDLDGVPTPKLIDFGIAKHVVLDESKNSMRLTQDGAPLGTPLYMSPEQIEGRTLDARVDVYALGVLLYEMLAGAAPFDAKNSDYYRMLVKVMEEEPQLPSSLLTSLGEDTQVIADKRQTDQKSLIRLLKGELDCIVLKAMEKDRDQRYGSVGELKADVERYFRNEPVSAKPKSLRYKATKFYQRHKFAVFIGCLLMVSLILGLAGTALGMFQAIAARDEAKISEDRALNTLAYLERILASADPSIEGRQMRIVDLLERATKMIDEDPNRDPYVESSVRRTLGWSYLEMGMYGKAEAQLLEAYELQKKIMGEMHPEVLNTLNSLGRLYYKQGQYPKAEEIHRQVFEKELVILGREDSTTFWTQYNLAKAIDKQGRYQEAERIYRDNIELREQLLGNHHGHTLIAKNSLALLLAYDARPEEAEALQQENFRDLERDLGGKHPQTLNAMANLVGIYLLGGKTEQARALAENTLALQMEILGEKHPDTLETQTYLARCYLIKGNLAEAESRLSAAHELQIEILGNSHPEALTTALDLALTRHLRGQSEKSLEAVEEIEALGKSFLKGDHWLFASSETLRGLCLMALNQKNLAETHLLKALERIKPFQTRERQYIRTALRDYYLSLGNQKKASLYEEPEKL